MTIRAVVEKLRIHCIIKPHEMKAVTVDVLGRFLHLTRENEMRTFAEEICRVPFTSYRITSNEEMEVSQSPSGPVPSTSAAVMTEQSAAVTTEPAPSTPAAVTTEAAPTTSSASHI